MIKNIEQYVEKAQRAIGEEFYIRYVSTGKIAGEIKITDFESIDGFKEDETFTEIGVATVRFLNTKLYKNETKKVRVSAFYSNSEDGCCRSVIIFPFDVESKKWLRYSAVTIAEF